MPHFEINERIYYKHPVFEYSRTGVINSNDGLCVELVDTGGISKPDNHDMLVSVLDIVKIEDAMNNYEIIAKLQKEASYYNLSYNSYLKLLKII